MKTKLNKTVIETAIIPPGKRRLKIWDTDLPGFYVVVGKTKTSYAVDYSLPGGRRKFGHVVGHWPIISPQAARELARKRLAEVKYGALSASSSDIDPGPPFGELCDEFLEYAEKNRRSYVTDKSRVKLHLKRWRSRPSLTIDRQNLRELAREIGERQGHPGAANRVLETVRRIYSLAEENGRIARGSNPAWQLRGLLFAEKGARPDRSATEDEIRKLVPVIWTAENPVCRALLWTLLLTGLRRREASFLRWEHVNLTKQVKVLSGRVKLAPGWLYIPHTKSGAPHWLPVSSALRAILEALPRECDWVFPGRGCKQQERNPLVWIDGQWQRIRALAGCDELTLHDLRATCASWMAQDGVQDRVIAQVLNHADIGVPRITRRYIDPSVLRSATIEALEEHGRRVLEVTKSSAVELVWPDSKSTKVLPFPKKTQTA